MADDLYAAIEACKQNMLHSLDTFEQRMKNHFQLLNDNTRRQFLELQHSPLIELTTCNKIHEEAIGQSLQNLDEINLVFGNEDEPKSPHTVLEEHFPPIINSSPTIKEEVHHIVFEQIDLTLEPRMQAEYDFVMSSITSAIKNDYEDVLEERYVVTPLPRIAPRELTARPPSMTTPPISNIEQEQIGICDTIIVVAITGSLLSSTTLMMKNNIEIVTEELNANRDKFSTVLGIPHHSLDQDTMMIQKHLAANNSLPLLPIPTSSVILVFDPGGHSSSQCSVQAQQQ